MRCFCLSHRNNCFLTKRNCVVMIYTLFESMSFTINCFPFSLFLDNSACLDSGISCYQNVVYVFLRQLKTVSQFWRFLKMVWYSVTCVHLVPPRVFRCYDEWWWMLSNCVTIYMLLNACCVCEDHAYCSKEMDIQSLMLFRHSFWTGV